MVAIFESMVVIVESVVTIVESVVVIVESAVTIFKSVVANVVFGRDCRVSGQNYQVHIFAIFKFVVTISKL